MMSLWTIGTVGKAARIIDTNEGGGGMLEVVANAVGGNDGHGFGLL